MQNYQITFWTPGHAPAVNDTPLFGCASLGFTTESGWAEPDSSEVAMWRSLTGEAYAGTYADVLAWTAKQAFTPSLALVFFTGGEGNDAFTDTLQTLLPDTMIAGGTAAKGEAQLKGETLPSGEDVAVLLVQDGKFIADCRNIHTDRLQTLRCEHSGKRAITAIHGEGGPNPQRYLSLMRSALNKRENDFESLTFCDSEGRNVHCGNAGSGEISCGADLQEEWVTLCAVSYTCATEAIRSYMCRENALAIGCAGLRSLIREPFSAAKGNVGVFLFGEIIRLPVGRSRFGNLMLGRVIPQE